MPQRRARLTSRLPSEIRQLSTLALLVHARPVSSGSNLSGQYKLRTNRGDSYVTDTRRTGNGTVRLCMIGEQDLLDTLATLRSGRPPHGRLTPPTCAPRTRRSTVEGVRPNLSATSPIARQ